MLYNTGDHSFVINNELYLIGSDNSLGHWDFSNCVTLTTVGDGVYRAYNVVVENESSFIFTATKHLHDFAFRPGTDNQTVNVSEIVSGATLANTAGNNAYTIAAGTYDVSFDIKDNRFRFIKRIDEMFIIGSVNGNSWDDCDTGVRMSRTSYNVYKAEHVYIEKEATFAFTTALGSSWEATNANRVTTSNGSTYWINSTDLETELGLEGPKLDSEKSFYMNAKSSYYDIEVNMNKMTVKLTERATPWDNITYEWTDGNGDSHTSNLLDVATDPYQVLDLFNAVYTNPKVPGQKYHNEYLLDGTPAQYQRNPRVIDYDLHSYILYYPVSFTTGTTNGYYVNFSPDGTIRDCRYNTPYTFKTNRNIDTYRKYWHRIPWLKINGKKGTECTLYPNGQNGQITPDDKVLPPEEDGMTMLLVEVADDWDSRRDYDRDAFTGGGSYRQFDDDLIPITRKSIKSVRVIPQYLRVNDPENPGYLFVIDKLTSQRFFFASKGREQGADGLGASTAPAFTAFEQISPRDFLIDPEVLRAGGVQYVAHDCYSIWQKGENSGHFIDLTGNEATTFSNLALFVPDKRFGGLDWDPTNYSINTSTSGQYVSSDLTKDYHIVQKYRPKMLLYKAFLNGSVTEAGTGVYQVNLNWDTWFDAAKLETNVDQQFYVYVQNATGDWVNVGTYHAQSGLGVGGTTRAHTLTYNIKQTDATQVLNYMVTANPIDVIQEGGIETVTASTIRVNTNVVTLVIPGRERFVLNVADHRSRYALDTEDEELNVYRNNVVVTFNNGVPATDQPFKLYRRSSAGDVHIANLTLEDGSNEGEYNYTLEYVADTQNYDITFASDDRKSDDDGRRTGTITAGGSFTCTDLFHVSTELNDHPDKYTYELMRYDSGEGKEISRSNRYVVPVLKSNTSVVMGGFTFDDVKNDTNLGLFEDHEIQVSFDARIDEQRALKRYNVHRVHSATSGFHAHVAKAERSEDNMISLVNLDHATGHLIDAIGTFDVSAATGGKMTLTAYDDMEYCPDPTVEYVTEIHSAIRVDGNMVQNTYGTQTASIETPQMTFTCDRKIRSNTPYGAAGNMKMAYGANLTVQPVAPLPNGLNVYRYRIWRIEPDGTAVLLNDIKPSDNQWVQLGKLNDEWPTPEKDTETGHDTYPAVQVYDAHESSPISPDLVIDDIDPETDEATTTTIIKSKKQVKYVARMYTSTSSESPSSASPAPRRVRNRGNEPAVGDDHQWYVTEKVITVDYDYYDEESTPTGVENIASDSRVVDVRYVNLQGMTSSRPFQGVNIVVSTRADGTVTTTKVVR